MHEMGIAAQMMKMIEAHLPPESSVKVKRINVTVGKFSGVSPIALTTCVEALARGTFAEGVSLSIDEVPIRTKCRECGAITDQEEPPFACTACGSFRTDIVTGRELYIDSIEVNDEAKSSDNEPQ